MEQISEQLRIFVPEWLTNDMFRTLPAEVQQDYLTRAQEAFDAQQQPILEAQSIFEELVPEEYFDDDYVYEEFDPVVSEDLFAEYTPEPHPQRSNGTFRGHPDCLRDLIENQLARGYQVRFVGTIKVRSYPPKPFTALFYNIFHLKRITFNVVHTDEEDVLFEGSFEISPAVRPTHFVAPRQHKRSRIGQGRDLYDLEEYEDEFVYIPASGFCFARCVAFLYGDEMQAQYTNFALQERIFSDRFPQCKIQRFNEFAGTKIGMYSEKDRKVRLCKDYDHVVAICDGHYIVLKQKRLFAHGFRIAQEKIVWQEKSITEEMLQDIKEVKQPFKQDFNMFEDTFVWDCETFPDAVTYDSVPYAAAYMPMNALASVSSILDSLGTASEVDITRVAKIKSKSIKVFNSNQHMLNSLSSAYRAKPPSERSDNGRLKSKNIYFYAHNAAKFDNYLLMILKHVSFKDILITGRGLVRVTTRHFLRQEDRVIKTGKRKGEIVSDKQFLFIHWGCTMSFLQGSLGGLCTSYKLPLALSKSAMDHTKVTADTVDSTRHIWLPYLKQDVLSLAICKYLYDRSIYENLAEKLDDKGSYRGIPLNSCISNSSLAWKAFLDKHYASADAEPIFAWQDPNIEKFIRETVYGGRVGAFNNKFEIEGWAELKAYLLEAFGVDSMNGIVQKVEQITVEIREEWERGPYRETPFDQYYSTEFLRLHPEKAAFMKEFIKNKELLLACDATSLYPSVQVLEELWPRIDTARLMIPSEKQSIMNALNSSSFFPKIGFFHVTMETPRSTFMSACACRSEHGNVLSVGPKTARYCSIDIEEEVKCNGSRVTDIHFGIICDDNYKTAIFRPFVQDQFEQRKRAKAAGNDVAQCSIKQCMCSLYGKQVQKGIMESWCIERSEESLKRNFDHRYRDVIKLENGSYACKKIMEKIKYMPSYMGSVQLAYSRKRMNIFILEIDGFRTKVVYYMDTDSLYIPSSAYKKLEAAGHIGSAMGQCKNDYGKGGIVFGLFIANKIKFCMTVTEEGVPEFHKTFKGHDNQTGLSYDDYESMINGESIQDVISRWERTLDKGVTIREANMTKSFDAKVNFLRRQEPDKDGWMHPIGYEA